MIINYANVSEKGQIESEGTFVGLQQKQANFLATLAREEITENTEKVKVDSDIVSDVASSGNVDEVEDEEEPEETEELLAKGSMSNLIYWKYIRSGGSIFTIIIFLLFLIVGQIGSSGCDYWVGYW